MEPDKSGGTLENVRLHRRWTMWPLLNSKSLLTFEENKNHMLPRPPKLIANHKKLVRVYMVNQEWKSFTAKLLVNIYMGIIAYMLWMTCDPWYTYFKYLTVWGWTLVQVYFIYTLYLDVVSRLRGRENVSEVATTFAQTVSELSFATQVVVTSFFWFCVYPQQPWRTISWEINMHGVGLLLMIFDYLYRFAGFSLRNLRVVYGFAFFYTLLHITTVFVSGEAIYPGLDFRNVYSFVIFLTGLTTIVATHKVFYLLHNWKRIREEWKTIMGISAFFLIPRKDSKEVLEVGDERPEKAGGLRSFAYREVLSVRPSIQARAMRRRTLQPQTSTTAHNSTAQSAKAQ